MQPMPFRLRVLAATAACAAALTAPALADLGAANNFAVLSPGRLSFGNFDVVLRVPAPSAATCPAGVNCLVLAGGTSITRGQNDTLYPHLTTSVSAAYASASAYSAFLASQHATRSVAPIALKPGARLTIPAPAGLSVYATPAIVLGSVNTGNADPCAKSIGDPAVITIEGTSASTVVFNIGNAGKGGALIVCDRSRIVLEGGITPDRVTFNVLGKGTGVTLGAATAVYGGILAPFQSVFTENGVRGIPDTLVEGSILAGGAVTLGDKTAVGFFPAQNVGVPAVVKVAGTVNLASLPAPVQQATTTESEDNPRQPALKVPQRFNEHGTSLSKITPPTANRSRLRRPHLTQVTNFAGVSQNGKTPSDVQFAAGTGTLLEMANITGALYTKPGHTLINTFDLGQFFLGSAGEGTDPRVYYDAATSNFIVAYELHPAGGDDIRLGIASDPGSSWTIYDVANNTTGATFDQPKLGVSSDKITISWNNYGTQSGASYIVIQKAGIVSRAASVPAWIWSDDTSRFQIVPANQYSADGGTQYAAWHCCGTSNVDLMAFTGVPGVSPVNFTDNAYGVGSVSGPPSGRQPSGGDPTINTDDDRAESAIWQNGNLWMDFNEGCTPAGDKTERACVRYVEIGTPNAGVRQNVSLQWAGNDVYYSSVVQDGGNSDRANLFFGVTYSSPTVDPTAMVLEVPNSLFGATTPALIELGGTTAFAGCTGTPCPRWGDYTAAGRDPSDTSKVWIANQYGGLSDQLWGTSITEVGN